LFCELFSLLGILLRTRGKTGTVWMARKYGVHPIINPCAKTAVFFIDEELLEALPELKLPVVSGRALAG